MMTWHMLNFKKACLYHIDLARSNGSKNAVKNLHACQLYNTWCCAHRVDTARFLPRRALILAHLRANLEHLHVPAQRAAMRVALLWLVAVAFDRTSVWPSSSQCQTSDAKRWHSENNKQLVPAMVWQLLIFRQNQWSQPSNYRLLIGDYRL